MGEHERNPKRPEKFLMNLPDHSVLIRATLGVGTGIIQSVEEYSSIIQFTPISNFEYAICSYPANRQTTRGIRGKFHSRGDLISRTQPTYGRSYLILAKPVRNTSGRTNLLRTGRNNRLARGDRILLLFSFNT